MKCCSTLSKTGLTQEITNAHQHNTHSAAISATSTTTTFSKINSGFESGFCEFCGVDVFLYS